MVLLGQEAEIQSVVRLAEKNIAGGGWHSQQSEAADPSVNSAGSGRWSRAVHPSRPAQKDVVYDGVHGEFEGGV